MKIQVTVGACGDAVNHAAPQSLDRNKCCP